MHRRKSGAAEVIKVVVITVVITGIFILLMMGRNTGVKHIPIPGAKISVDADLGLEGEYRTPMAGGAVLLEKHKKRLNHAFGFGKSKVQAHELDMEAPTVDLSKQQLSWDEIARAQAKAKQEKALELKSKPPGARPRRNFARCETTKGALDVTLRYDWSPHGAERMAELIDVGFFTNMTFFRVPPLGSNPIAQFGATPLLNVRRTVESWKAIPDDFPMRQKKRGDFGFGGSGTNSRTHHMWVARDDFANHSPALGKSVWDVPVAEVTNPEGLEAVSKIEMVGDMKPWGDGPDTGEMQRDPTFYTDFPGDYLRKKFPKVDWFIGCKFVD